MDTVRNSKSSPIHKTRPTPTVRLVCNESSRFMFVPVRDVTVAIRQPPDMKEALPDDVELLDQLLVYSPHFSPGDTASLADLFAVVV